MNDKMCLFAVMFDEKCEPRGDELTRESPRAQRLTRRLSSRLRGTARGPN